MATNNDYNALLDQLQAQVNQVLEQTGRVFAAMSANPKQRPVAQTAKLQNVLPVAENRFHDALDQLENELQLTMLVMRRDLAACRERSGLLTRNQAPTQPAVDTLMDITTDEQQKPDAKPVEAPVPEPQQPQPTEDIVMEDGKPSIPEADATQNAKPTQQPSEQESELKSQEHSTTDSKPAGDDAKAANIDLHIDTKPVSKDEEGQANEDEKAPDTAAETNNDLDSLFNDDAMSTSGMPTHGGDFNFDQDNGGIDFGDFGHVDTNTGNDNDNLASLLPGLEDYANTQSNEVDLDQLFNLNSNDDNNGMNAQGAGEHGDSFEDLLAGFEGDTVDDNQNTAANQDFDYDSLFS